MLSAGALAQTTTPTAPAAPAQTAPAAPAQTAPATRAQTNATTQTTLAANEVTSTSIVGAAIYAPKAGGSAANRTADPATTASTAPRTGTNAATPANSNAAATASNMGFPSMGDAEWNAMKGNHDHIGEVNNLVVGTDGRIHQVVLGVGGFLGIGEKSVSVRFSDVRWMMDSNGKVFGIVQRTKQELEAAPRFVDRS
jgi:hypothetical protein